jgi:alkaline phosphatase D
VNELHSDFSNPERPVVAAEFVGTSISSGGDGSDRNAMANDAMLSDNPHIKWQNSRRGYVTCTVTPDAWTAEYRTVSFVSKPDAPVSTPTKWRVEHGRPGIQKA